MSQTKRIAIVVAILAVVIMAIVGIDALRRSLSTSGATVEGEPTLVPGGIPIRFDGQLAASFEPTDLEQIEMVSFVEAEEGKTEEGWLLRDVLLLHFARDEFKPDTLIVVSSSSREKSVDLTWAEVDDPNNWVMFDLAGRGTLKLVSVLERLDVRDEWVQDVDSIKVRSP